MRALIIRQQEQRLIAQALELARQRPMRWEEMQHMAIGPNQPHLKLKDRPQGFRPKSEFVNLPNGFLVAVSFEEQPAGLFTHLSVSIDEPGKVPNPHAVSVIAKAFGLSGELPPDNGSVWLEEFEPGHSAVNVLELVASTTFS